MRKIRGEDESSGSPAIWDSTLGQMIIKRGVAHHTYMSVDSTAKKAKKSPKVIPLGCTSISFTD
mgnify:CR=1 FL=1